MHAILVVPTLIEIAGILTKTAESVSVEERLGNGRERS